MDTIILVAQPTWMEGLDENTSADHLNTEWRIAWREWRDLLSERRYAKGNPRLVYLQRRLDWLYALRKRNESEGLLVKARDGRLCWEFYLNGPDDPFARE